MTTTPARFLVFWERPTDPEAFEHHYRDVHIPLVRKLPGLRSYAITDTCEPVRGEPYFRIAELRWDTMDDLRADFASAEGRAVGADFASAEGRAVGADVEKMEEWAVCRSMILGPFEELL